jgi:queuine tRNA-ribosyltransferase
VHRGVDMFDCILPTAWAQHGKAFTSHGRVDLRRGTYKLAEAALDAACDCTACVTYSRSYLHHLIKCDEPLGWQLLATHNLHFYLRLVRDMRRHIIAGTFMRFYTEQRERLALSDPEHPPGPRPRSRTPRARERGAFALHVAPAGFASIQHVASGEIMHSVNDPDDEAERVYVAQSRRIAQARMGAEPLVVWDVGLGAAHNAMALVRALATSPGHAAVELVSFERDLDALRLALSHLKHFSHLRDAPPHLLVEYGRFERPGLVWRLVEGDFATTFATEPPADVIFYDPFSSKVDRPLWELVHLRRLRAHLTRDAELFTYSSSTAVRSSLLAAGFAVARGVSSGPKEETTIALAGDTTGYALLGADWLARRARSTARFGADVPAELHAELDRAIEMHAQFR